MARFATSVPSDRSVHETFGYLADFRNLAEWDPSVTSSVLTAGRPGEVGSTYDVTFSLASQDVLLPYETLEVDAGNRIVMRAETDSVISLDTIRVHNGNRVRVDYSAEIDLKGARAPADPTGADPTGDLALARAGRKAAEGLAERLTA